MAPPNVRPFRPSARLRLDTFEDRFMCGEAGLLSAAVVGEVGLRRSAVSGPMVGTNTVMRPTAHAVAFAPPVRPAALVDLAALKAARLTTERPARPSVEPSTPATSAVEDPLLELVVADLGGFNLGAPDRSIESTGLSGVGGTDVTPPAEVPASANSAPIAPSAAPDAALPPAVSAKPATTAPTEGNTGRFTGVGPDTGPLSATQAAADPATQFARLTGRNRNSATMSGGWNPALRGVLVMADGSRWFAAETGADISVNSAMVYYKLGPTGWKAMGSVMLPAGIQQNMATVTNGRMIYSYGVAGDTVVEAWFDTRRPRFNLNTGNAITAGGVALSPGEDANYVGAAWHNNTRVVWWSMVGNNGAGGRWAYAFNSGRGWNGPIVSGASGYSEVGYVRARFDAVGRMHMVGEAYLGAFPAGRTYLVTGFVRLGNAVQWVPVQPKAARSPLDLWRADGAQTHFLYRRGPFKIGYVYGARSSEMPTVFNALEARFISDDTRLGLVLAYKDALEVRLVPRDQAAGPIDWLAIPPVTLSLPADFKGKGVSAIWAADEAKQPLRSDLLEFAVGGRYPVRDHLIYYVTV